MDENPYEAPRQATGPSSGKPRDMTPSRELWGIVRYWSMFAAMVAIVIWIGSQILHWYLSQIVVPETLSG